MLSATTTANSLTSPSAAAHTTFLLHSRRDSPLPLFLRRRPNPISATFNPSPSTSPSPSAAKQQIYQPFRAPPSPLPPQYRSLDAAGKLDVLSNRLGLWFEYAPLITSLIKEGFTPPTIEEITGIGGVQQNTLVVGAQVRDSLVQTTNDSDLIAAFDTSGSELLYEIRLVNTEQRAAAARFIVENKLDGKGAQELARAMKDFPRRKGDRGWESFDYDFPGDCLAFMYYRLSREYKDSLEATTAALEEGLKVAATEAARTLLLRDLERNKEGKEEIEEEIEAVKVPVVRMKFGEVAESTTVLVVPVCKAEDGDKGVGEAPMGVRSEGEFGVVVAEEAWKRWVVLPGWEPVVGLAKEGGGVVVAFRDARALPWRVNKWYKEEPILVVVDRRKKEVVTGDGFYLTAATVGGGGNGDLKVQRGNALMEIGVDESLGTVLVVVRPPKDLEDNQLSDEDWD